MEWNRCSFLRQDKNWQHCKKTMKKSYVLNILMDNKSIKGLKMMITEILVKSFGMDFLG